MPEEIRREREEERRQRENQRISHFEKEKTRLRNRVDDIFPGGRATTNILSDARWCTPCAAFNLGQCELQEKQHPPDRDRLVKHICLICHYAAAVCNSHTARNCKLERFLDHEVDKLRDEHRQMLRSRREEEDRREGWHREAPPQTRDQRVRYHPYPFRPNEERR